MDIVDAQIHLWQAEAPDRPWPPGRAHEAQKPYPISKETLLFQMERRCGLIHGQPLTLFIRH